MVWGKVKHERKFSIYLLSLALHARIPGRCPSYRSSIGDYHLLYDQVEIDRWKLDWGSAFFDEFEYFVWILWASFLKVLSYFIKWLWAYVAYLCIVNQIVLIISFKGSIFQYLVKNIPLFIKILFLKSRIIWMLLRKIKLEIIMNVWRFSFLYSQKIKGK